MQSLVLLWCCVYDNGWSMHKCLKMSAQSKYLKLECSRPGPGKSNEHWGMGVEIRLFVIGTKRKMQTERLLVPCLISAAIKRLSSLLRDQLLFPCVITATLWKESRILTCLWFCHHVFLWKAKLTFLSDKYSTRGMGSNQQMSCGFHVRLVIKVFR